MTTGWSTGMAATKLRDFCHANINSLKLKFRTAKGNVSMMLVESSSSYKRRYFWRFSTFLSEGKYLLSFFTILANEIETDEDSTRLAERRRYSQPFRF